MIEKEIINNKHWADLTLEELELMTDFENQKEYLKRINEFYLLVINTFSTLVPKNFKFSVSNDKLTCRVMATDYMNYFYSKGMTREEIVNKMVNSKFAINEGKNK